MAIKGLAKSFNSIFKRSRTPPQAAVAIQSPAPLFSKSNKEDELRQVFKFLDTNNDGKVSSEELTAYFASIGESITLDDVEEIIREYLSKDASSESMMLMGFEDFARVVEMRDDGEDDCKGLMRQVFEVYEVEKGSGFITPEGLRQVLRRLGDAKTTVEECKGMIRAFDIDGNGVLDFDEFYKMMMT